MGSFRYESQGTNTYLVYEIDAMDSVDSMTRGMITNNRIQGLAQALFTQMDTQMFIKYNVSAKVSVSQFFEGAVNRKRLIGVFNGIVDALISAEEYMIDARSILLDMDYIFSDVSTCETILICLPLECRMEKETNLGMFFKSIMFNTQFDQTENSDHVAKIINYLNGTPSFSLYEFKNVLQSINSESSQQNFVGEQAVVNLVPSEPFGVQSVPVQETKPASGAPIPATQPIQPVVSMQPVQSVTPTHAATMPGSGKSTMPDAVMKDEKKSVTPDGMKIPTSSNSQKVGGMNIPGGNKKIEQEQPQVTKGEKEISWFYLMQHYNKDNAAAYKAQKEAKKEVKKNSSKNGKGKKSAEIEMPGQLVKEQNIAPQSNELTPTQVALFNHTATQQPVVQQPIVQQVQQIYTQPAMIGGFGETTVLGGPQIGETTVLSQVQNPMQPALPYLIRSKNSEKIMLDKPSFRIGKERSFVDYFIGDNTAISRCHANIIERDGERYIIDTNSTNHTFVNGMMINSNEEVKLSDGDKVRLANEDFEFHLR